MIVSPENNMNEKKINSSSNKRPLCLLTIAFTVIVALLITTFILMWTLIPRSVTAPSKSNVCQTEACIRASALLLRTVDQSVDPCHDFYSFACGRLMRQPYDSKTIESGISLMNEESTLLNAKMFDLFYNADLARSEDPDMNQMYEAVSRMFLSCVSFHDPNLWWVKEKLKKLGDNAAETDSSLTVVEPLMKWLDDASSIEEFLAVLVRTSTSGFMYFRDDVFQPILEFETMEFSFNGPWNETISNEVTKLMGSLNVSITDATELVKYQNKFYSHNFTDIFSGTLTDLENESRKHGNLSFNWTSFLKKLDLSHLDPKTTIKIGKFSEFVKVLTQIATEFRDRNGSLYDFLRFDALMTLRVFLPMNNYPLLKELYNNQKYVIDKEEGDDKTKFLTNCMKMAQDAMKPVVFEMFEKAYITDNFSLIHSIVSELQVAMKQNVDSESWILRKSKQILKDRIDAIERSISYYRMPTSEIKTTFRQSMQIFNRGKTFGHLVLFYQDAKFRRNLWLITSQAPVHEIFGMIHNQLVVNAFYHPGIHSIHIITGILGTYLYNNDYPEYLLYGGIGTVIGHEIAHAFDETSFSSITIPSDENETLLRYEENSNCLVDTYSQMMMAPNSTRVNGSYTVGENFADIVGINAAFKAYKNQVSAHQRPLQLLPGPLGSKLSPDQLFFVQAAQFSCEKMEKEMLVMYYARDEHSPARPRILGFTRHSKDFSKVFQCKPGDSMYLSDSNKCHNW